MLDWVGYQLVVLVPWFIARRTTCNAESAIGRWCLPRAGNWIFR